MAGIFIKPYYPGSFAGAAVLAYAVSAGSYSIAQEGSISVAAVASSSTSFVKSRTLTGDISVSILPSASLSHASVWSKVGTVQITTFVNSSINKAKDYIGSVSFDNNVDSLLSNAFVSSGSVSFNVLPESITIYEDNSAIDGDISLSFLISGSINRYVYKGIHPSIPSPSGSISKSVTSSGIGIIPSPINPPIGGVSPT